MKAFQDLLHQRTTIIFIPKNNNEKFLQSDFLHCYSIAGNLYKVETLIPEITVCLK